MVNLASATNCKEVQIFSVGSAAVSAEMRFGSLLLLTTHLVVVVGLNEVERHQSHLALQNLYGPL